MASLIKLHTRSLPRLGGGVSRVSRTFYLLNLSSPPRRGCFFSLAARLGLGFVFPASAGVFPLRSFKKQQARGLPRLGGGVSPKIRYSMFPPGLPRLGGGVSGY